jgi:hypothetical protein
LVTCSAADDLILGGGEYVWTTSGRYQSDTSISTSTMITSSGFSNENAPINPDRFAFEAAGLVLEERLRLLRRFLCQRDGDSVPIAFTHPQIPAG